ELNIIKQKVYVSRAFHRNLRRPSSNLYSQQIYSEFMYQDREKRRPLQFQDLGLFPLFAFFGDGLEGEHDGVVARRDAFGGYMAEDFFVFLVRQVIADSDGFEGRVQSLEVEIVFQKVMDELANGFFLVQSG